MSFQKKIEHFILKYLAVPKTPKYLEGKRHIACIGDSITQGTGGNIDGVSVSYTVQYRTSIAARLAATKPAKEASSPDRPL